ncbi:MAG: hypothetical protein H7A35_13250 [Planctomycetales bacterium]|nr:MAG: hypothetical protein H7A35_13250 [Planctomycetales bacterium]
MKIKAEIHYVDVENENGYEVEGVMARCTRCGHETESFGVADNSIRRCLKLLNEECPNGENNFYEED